MSDHFGKISIEQPGLPVSQRPLPKKRAAGYRRKRRKKPRLNNKFWIGCFFLGIIFSVYCIGGFIGIPYYISTKLVESVSEKTGLIFRVGKVSFNPLTFVFSSETIRILSRDEKRPDLLKIAYVEGKLAPFSLLRNDLVSNYLTIDKLEANITREVDGSYNYSSLFLSPHKNNPAKMMGFSDLPFHFSLNNIAVSKSNIVFSDLPLEKTHSIENIQLTLPTLSNFPFQANNYIQPSFSATINGSPLKLTGQANVGENNKESHAADLSCDIQSLDLPFYLGYLPFNFPLDLAKGKADGKIGLKFSPEGKKGEKLAVSFDLTIKTAELSSLDSALEIAAPTTHLKGIFYPVSKHIHMETVSLRDPVFTSFGESFPNNLRHTFIRDSETQTTTIPATPFTTDIDLMFVDGGVLQLFKEKTSKKPYTEWRALQFSLKHYTSTEDNKHKHDPGFFRLSGEQPRASSSFSWQGDLNEPNILKGDLRINNIKATTLFNTLNIRPLVNAKGIADLQSTFLLNLTKNHKNSTPYSLINTNILLQNFSLIESKGAVLAAPLVKISDLSTSDKKTDFGNISIANGVLNIVGEQPFTPFSLFTQKNFQLQNISFDGKATFLANSKYGSKINFSHFNLKATNLHLSEQAENNISITAKTEKGGIFEAKGTLYLYPLKGSLETKFNSLQSDTVLPWFTDSLLMTSLRGNIGGEGNLTLPDVLFKGSFDLVETSILDDKETVITWDKGIFHEVNISTKPFHLSIKLAELEGPELSWAITTGDSGPIESFSIFLQKYLPSVKQDNNSEKKPTTSSFDIQEIIFENGKIQVEDQRISPPWTGEIFDLTGNISDIYPSKPSTTSQFYFTGKLDDSPFIVKGKSQFYSEKKNGSFEFSITDFPIADFHEQLAPQFDIDTSKGKFSIELNSLWKEGLVSNFGSVTFFKVEPESQMSQSALPLALLADQDGSFTLNFSSDQKEPSAQFVLFDQMVTRFQKLVVKSSVSPLLLATGDYTDLIGDEFIEFRPGETVMSPKGKKIASRFATLLTENPGVGITISGNYDETMDATAMKAQLEATEAKRVAAENKRRFKQWQEQKQTSQKTVDEKPNNDKFIPLQPQQVSISKKMLMDLAEKRAEVVYQYFLTQSNFEPGKIIIIDSEQLPSTKNNTSSGITLKITPLN